MLSKLRAEPGALRAVQAKEGEPATIQLRMLVHSRLCGMLIGKGGATIRSFNEDSRAVFNISPPPTVPGVCGRPCSSAAAVPARLPVCAVCVLCCGGGRPMGDARVMLQCAAHHRSHSTASFSAAAACLPPQASPSAS